MDFQVRAVSKSFSGFEVLKQVDFSLNERGIYGLIGPNGAGKTTLFNIISRVMNACSGDIQFNQQSLMKAPAHTLARLGVCRTFQLKSAFERMNVRENILSAIYSRDQQSLNLFTRHSALNHRQEVENILGEFNLLDLADTPVSALSYGQKKILELSTAKAFAPKLLLLDEPLAGVGLAEIERIREIILNISKQSTLLIIDHNMHFIKQLCEKIFVLHQGSIICEGSFDELSSNSAVLAAYLGEEKNEA